MATPTLITGREVRPTLPCPQGITGDASAGLSPSPRPVITHCGRRVLPQRDRVAGSHAVVS